MINFILDKLTGKVPLLSKRSGKWPTVRKAYLEVHGECAACGSKHLLEVHHMMPFHLKPELELDPNNFITLCESGDHGINCHLAIGHLGNFKNFNPDVIRDAENMRKLIK